MNKQFIQEIVNVFETGNPEFNVSSFYFLYDGPDDIKQLTIGSGITEWGNLKEVVELFCSKNGEYGLKKFIKSIGKISLADDTEFLSKLKDATKTKEWRDSYLTVFDKKYWQAAQSWFLKGGFTYPLSMLVIYYSFLQSGRIRKEIRNMFPEKVPAEGGDEKEWIFQYSSARKKWKKRHSNKAVRASVYRDNDILREINSENWELESPIKANGVELSEKK